MTKNILLSSTIMGLIKDIVKMEHTKVKNAESQRARQKANQGDFGSSTQYNMNRKTLRFILAVSTHTALQLPQSPLLPCRRNISFPANSYPLKRWKFHLIYKNGRGFERRTYQEQIQLAVRVGLPILWAAGLLKVQRSDFSATLPNNKQHHRESVAHQF